jgi:hypothetical protein
MPGKITSILILLLLATGANACRKNKIERHQTFIGEWRSTDSFGELVSELHISVNGDAHYYDTSTGKELSGNIRFKDYGFIIRNDFPLVQKKFTVTDEPSAPYYSSFKANDRWYTKQP